MRIDTAVLVCDCLEKNKLLCYIVIMILIFLVLLPFPSYHFYSPWKEALFYVSVLTVCSFDVFFFITYCTLDIYSFSLIPQLSQYVAWPQRQPQWSLAVGSSVTIKEGHLRAWAPPAAVFPSVPHVPQHEPKQSRDQPENCKSYNNPIYLRERWTFCIGLRCKFVNYFSEDWI